MVKIELIIEEKISQNIFNLGINGIAVKIKEKGIKATENEKEIAEEYINKLDLDKKVIFKNESKENTKEVEKLIKELEDKFFKK